MELRAQPRPVVDLDEAVRMFRRLVPPESVDKGQPPTASMVYTPWIVSWLMVYQRLSGYGTLSAAVAELTRLNAELLPDTKRVREGTLSSNTGAYAQARDRLDVESAQSAATEVSNALIAESAPSLGERRVFIVDGSTLSLAPSDSLRQAFPPAQNQHGSSHWPILRLVTAHELSSGAAIYPEIGRMYGSDAVGEVELSQGLLARLPAASVLLGDRNFGVFAFAWQTQQHGHDFVLRLKEDRFRAMVRRATPTGEGEWTLSWKPSRQDRRNNPGVPAEAVVRVRLHEVRLSEQLTLWMVSSVDETKEVLAELYHGRQHIETDLRDLKRTLRLEEIRSRSVELVRKELAAATIAYNLVVLIRRLAAANVQVEPRRLSFSRVWALVKVLLLESFTAGSATEAQQRIERVLRMAGQCKLPNRPNRQYPREVIPRRRKFPERKRNKADP
jgi:hypothetical protein